MSGFEREVLISFNAAEDMAEIYTADPVWIRKMDKLRDAYPETFRETEECMKDGAVISKRYVFPKKLITIRSKAVTMSEEQRKKNAERLARMREAKNVSDTDSTSENRQAMGSGAPN